MRFRAPAGTYEAFSLWRSKSILRSAASIASGVVSCALQWLSDTPGTSDLPPGVPVAHQLVRLVGPLRAGLVLRQRAGGLLPCLHDRVADAPLRLDLIVAGEERRLAAHRVEDQALVGLRGLRQERRAVEELHVHRADLPSVSR